MGVGFSSSSGTTSLALSFPNSTCFTYCPTTPKATTFAPKSQSNPFLFHSTANFLQSHFRKLAKAAMDKAPSSAPFSLRCGTVEEMETQKDQDFVKPSFDPHSIDPELVQKMAYDALVWSSLHGLVVGERNSQVILVKILPLFCENTVLSDFDCMSYASNALYVDVQSQY